MEQFTVRQRRKLSIDKILYVTYSMNETRLFSIAVLTSLTLLKSMHLVVGLLMVFAIV